MAESIRDLIAEKSALLRDVDTLGPAKAEEVLVELSSLLSSLNKEIADTHYWFNLKRIELLKEYKTVAKTRLIAEGSQEWKDWQDRLQQKEATEEMLRSLKFYIKGARSEQGEFTPR